MVSRTPYGCVDWNCFQRLPAAILVALCVSAWIETWAPRPYGWNAPPAWCVDWNTHILGDFWLYAACHTLRESAVDWNNSHCRHGSWRQSQRPRECVDWNKNVGKATNQLKSHSAWVVDWNNHSRTPLQKSHSAWVRGLAADMRKQNDKEVTAWVRGLNLP